MPGKLELASLAQNLIFEVWDLVFPWVPDAAFEGLRDVQCEKGLSG